MFESVVPTAAAELPDMSLGREFVAHRRRLAAAEIISRHSRMDAESAAISALMERYAAGHDNVFAHLYQLISPRLYRFCMRLTAVPAEADDCFQDTLLRLHRARATFKEGANALHWVFAIARSVYLTKLRYWRRRPEQLGLAADVAQRAEIHPRSMATPETHVCAEHLLATVAQELMRMSEKNRIAYVLLKEEGLSAKDAAAVLGTSADAVKQRAHRAYEQLKTALDAAGWNSHELPLR
jgi:RNA polymerase sigma-70 factor (ECF subfamily)